MTNPGHSTEEHWEPACPSELLRLEAGVSGWQAFPEAGGGAWPSLCFVIDVWAICRTRGVVNG